MKFHNYIFFSFALLFSLNSFGQCQMWNPTMISDSWNDFNAEFGGAPCDDGSGCPFNQIETFQVFAAEAYRADHFVAGGEYAFSMCNGPDAGTWVPEFTIIAPSGAIDAFGGGDGDSCTITWIASESGTYKIVINEEGFCGDGDNTDVNNGFPAMTCLNSPMCIPPDSICNAGIISTIGEFVVCGSEDSLYIEVNATIIPEGGGFGYSFNNDLGGTGALPMGFLLSNTDPITAYTSDINGVLTDNNLEPLSGIWVIKSVSYTDPEDPSETICSVSEDSMIVNFTPDLILNIENNGDGSATALVSGGSAPYTYLWSDDASQIAETAINLVDGDYTVTVTDALGCEIEGGINLVMSSIENLEIVENIIIGPNPSDGRFSIDLILNNVEDIFIEVLDLTGKTIHKETFRSEHIVSNIFLENASTGIYLVHVKIGEVSNYKKIVVSR